MQKVWCLINGKNETCQILLLRGGVVMKEFWGFLKEEDGATAVEYGLLVALIAAVIVAVVSVLGGKVSEAFQTVVDSLS